MLKPSSLATWGVAAMLMTSLTSCEDIFEQYFPKPTPTPPTVPTPPPVAYALASRSPDPSVNVTLLASFNPENPSTAVTKPVTGLNAFNRLIALDRRPATGQFYALGIDQRLYTLDVNTGAATRVSDQILPIISFGLIGFDFNPVTDRLRIVNARGTNLAVNPTDGTFRVDTPLNPGAATGIAYDNNVAGATSTRLFALDIDQLYRIDAPAAGTLTPVGPTGVRAGAWDFDIGRTSSAAYALVDNVVAKQVYRIDLATGRATRVGELDPQAFPGNFESQGFTLGAGL
ncbi:DUF4394 domain-containing protein [Hymenobacter sp. HD11105]